MEEPSIIIKVHVCPIVLPVVHQSSGLSYTPLTSSDNFGNIRALSAVVPRLATMMSVALLVFLRESTNLFVNFTIIITS